MFLILVTITGSAEPLKINCDVVMLVYLSVKLHEMKLAIETLELLIWDESVLMSL